MRNNVQPVFRVCKVGGRQLSHIGRPCVTFQGQMSGMGRSSTRARQVEVAYVFGSINQGVLEASYFYPAFESILLIRQYLDVVSFPQETLPRAHNGDVYLL